MTAAEKAKDAILRNSLTLLVQGHEAESIVQILAEVIDDHAHVLARRTGDYDHAGKMIELAKKLAQRDDA